MDKDSQHCLTYQQWLKLAEKRLAENVSQDPFLNAKFDANLLLQWVTEQSKARILAFADTLLTDAEHSQLDELLERRVQGEPMAYILGETEFWSLPLKVSPHTLIPRPDTEMLVEKALELAKQRLNPPHFTGNLRILDLGTGTGAIALALCKELQPITQKCGVNLQIFAVDCIPEAVQLAQQNAQLNGLQQIQFLQSDWFGQLDRHVQFDLIVSNPPYIDENDPHLLRGDVRFEPLSALVAADQGLADIQNIIENAPHFLMPNGWLLLEHGWQQAEKVRWIFQQNGWQQVASLTDYGGNSRVTFACLEGK